MTTLNTSPVPNTPPPKSDTTLTSLPAHELSRYLVAKQVSATEVVGAFIDRIERLDGKLHAFIALYPDDALAAAAAADKARAAGHAVGPLHGIPVAVKDIVDVEGRVTTGGSAVWRDRRSPHTATLVTRMLKAGMILLGKTHSVEFAMGSWGTNEHLGTPWNPWDPVAHRAPGGSSAGSAVAVAAQLAPWAIGTDTGGSVRIPSAYCGLTGLKTTFGRVSCHGVLPLSFSLDTPGPMCRDVEDTALLFDLLQGCDPRDSNTMGLPAYDADAWAHGDLSGLRLGTIPDDARSQVDDGVLKVYDEALDVLTGLGARLQVVEFPETLDVLGAEVGTIIGAEGYSFVGDLVDDPALPVDADVRPRIQLGRDLRCADYLRGLQRRREVTARFDSAWADVRAVLTPTAATVAPRIEEIDQGGTAAAFTRPINYLGRCALAVPAGLGPHDMPVSLQIAGRALEEHLVLRVGRAFQSVTDWHLRLPPEGN